MSNINDFEKIIDYKFKNISYLYQALTHTSYINEVKDKNISSNERMEFLGDSILGLCVSEFLFQNYKSLSEGVLSKIRASVVCESSLASLARKLKLGDYLVLGKGEKQTGGAIKPSVTSDAMESVICAIYLDSNYETVKERILFWLKDDIIAFAEKKYQFTDFKSKLQEYCQDKGFTPEYSLIGESGPDHMKTFEFMVKIPSGLCATGKSTNKKKAQMEAAKALLDKLE